MHRLNAGLDYVCVMSVMVVFKDLGIPTINYLIFWVMSMPQAVENNLLVWYLENRSVLESVNPWRK